MQKLLTSPTDDDDAYDAKLPINCKKLEELKKLIKPFYDVDQGSSDAIVAWPTPSRHNEHQTVNNRFSLLVKLILIYNYVYSFCFHINLCYQLNENMF